MAEYEKKVRDILKNNGYRFKRHGNGVASATSYLLASGAAEYILHLLRLFGGNNTCIAGDAFDAFLCTNQVKADIRGII